MSRECIDIFRSKQISREEVINEIAKIKGGVTYKINDEPIGTIQRAGSAIWIYYEDEEHEFREYISDLSNRFNLKPVVNIWVELSGKKDAGKLALEFCKKLATVYNDIVVSDEDGEYYVAKDLFNLEVKDDWSWGFKKSL